jgi:hypothetical protein
MPTNYWWYAIPSGTFAPPNHGGYILNLMDLDRFNMMVDRERD